jgi:dTDP-4-dehydrorhamnose 3,5-epimerase
MSNYIDHLPTWEALSKFHDFSRCTVLEYGCGVGTKTLCKLFKKCISVELYHEDFLLPNWFQQLSDELEQSQVSNWCGKLVRVDGSICQIEDDIRKNNLIQTRNLESPSKEFLKQVIQSDIEKHRPDVVFVDPGIHLRGEIARIIMENYWSPLVVLHDYNWQDDRYGYHLLKDIPNYSLSVPIPGGLGTAVYSQSVTDCLVKNLTKFKDNRGFFSEIFNQNNFDFVVKQINHSQSKKGTLRGIHKAPFEKLVTCVKGRILDVCVDLRPESPTHLQHVAVELNEQNGLQLLVPKNCGHGFLALEEATVIYSQSDVYCPRKESSVRFDDPKVGIKWPVMEYIISDKDLANPSL